MGLFKKRSADPDDVARLRSEIAAMGARIDAADDAKAELGGRVEHIASRLEDPDSLLPRPAEPEEPPVTRSDHDLLGARVQQLTEQLEAAIVAREEAEAGVRLDAARFESLRERLDALTDRLDTPIGPPPTEPPPVAAVDPAEIDGLRDQLRKITDRLDEVDARITSISTELANQISEIGSDLDAHGPADSPGGEAVGEVVGELRDAQTRLANEQARYQIAFRQDLADLAARLKRG